MNANGDHDEANSRDPNDVEERDVNVRAAPEISPPRATKYTKGDEQNEGIPNGPSSIGRR